MQIPALSLAGDNTEVKKWGENKGVEKEKKKLNAELAEWRQKTTIANKQQKRHREKLICAERMYTKAVFRIEIERRDSIFFFFERLAFSCFAVWSNQAKQVKLKNKIKSATGPDRPLRNTSEQATSRRMRKGRTSKRRKKKKKILRVSWVKAKGEKKKVELNR